MTIDAHEILNDNREHEAPEEEHVPPSGAVPILHGAEPEDTPTKSENAGEARSQGNENPLLSGAYSVAESLTAPWPKPLFVVRDWGITAGPITLLCGFGFSGKTLLAISVALAVASGRPLFGRYPVKHGKVIHFDLEQGKDETLVRYRRLATGMGIDKSDLADLTCVSFPRFTLDHPDARRILSDAVRDHTLCIIDSLRPIMGADENDSRSRKYLDLLNEISDITGCAFIVIHHAGKGDRADKRQVPRGSSALFDAPGTVLVLEAKDRIIALTQAKSRNVIFDGLHFEFESLGAYCEEIGRTDTLRLGILDAGAEEPTVREKTVRALRGAPEMRLHTRDLQKKVGVKKERYLATRAELVAEGVVLLVKKGREDWYALDEARAKWEVPEAYVENEPPPADDGGNHKGEG